jgi:hypothetical protein
VADLGEAARVTEGADLPVQLRGVGAAGVVEVRERPSWLAREQALWEEAAGIDPGGDPALASLRDEAVASLKRGGLLRRVLAVAAKPGA